MCLVVHRMVNTEHMYDEYTCVDCGYYRWRRPFLSVQVEASMENLVKAQNALHDKEKRFLR